MRLLIDNTKRIAYLFLKIDNFTYFLYNILIIFTLGNKKIRLVILIPIHPNKNTYMKISGFNFCRNFVNAGRFDRVYGYK